MGRAITDYRKVTITFDNGVDAQAAMSPDAYKAAIKKVEQMEAAYNRNPAGVVDLDETEILVTGTLPYRLFVFTATTVVADGTYEFVFVEERPNVDDEA